MEKKIPPPKPPRTTKVKPRIDIRISTDAVTTLGGELKVDDTLPSTRSRHKTDTPVNLSRSVFYGSNLERIAETDLDIRNGGEKAIQRLSFPHFSSLDRRELTSIRMQKYDNIVNELNTKKPLLKGVAEKGLDRSYENVNISVGEEVDEDKNQMEICTDDYSPSKDRLNINRPRSRSVDMLDSPPSLSATATKNNSIIQRKKTSKKQVDYCQSAFFVSEEEKMNIMETKPLVAKLIKGVNDSGIFSVLETSYLKDGTPPDTPTESEVFDTDSEEGKWNPAIDKCGTIYVYSANGGESKWNLQENEDVSPSSLSSPSLISFDREKEQAVREDILIWRLIMKEGKKAKKSWCTSYAKYYPNLKKNIFGKSFGSITFAKKLNDNKKVECFDLVPPCYIDSNLKKQNSLCLRNGDLTEVLIQADTPTVATEWVKLLIEYDKVQERNLSAEKDKKSTKGPDKSQSKKEPASDDADATKGIKDSLMLFFKKRIQQETLAKKGIYKDTVFGSTIADLCQKEQLNTPVFVLQCIKNIEKNKENFTMDGLYRISGNASKIQKIRIEIAQNRYTILEEEKDVHNLTGALKLFFRELKEPLIPFANYPHFISATDHMKTKIRVEALRIAVKKLPICNRETMKILLDHLLKVNEYEHENRMSIMNLAIVFGPCLLWPETTSGFDLMTDAMLHNRVVESLLSLFDDIFRKK